MIFKAYHATDESNVKDILENGFIYHSNPRHWLGNGAYFFIDPGLAFLWCVENSSSYGEIKNGVVLVATIETDDKFTLDLRLIDNFNDLKKLYATYVEFCKIVCQKNKKYVNPNDHERFRSSFFNWLIQKKSIQCIIAYINTRDDVLQGMPSCKNNFEKMDIGYHEVQVCVSQLHCIKERKIFEKEGDFNEI